VTCRKGEATDVPNQDNYLIYVDAYTKVYSVYDGHGIFIIRVIMNIIKVLMGT